MKKHYQSTLIQDKLDYLVASNQGKDIAGLPLQLHISNSIQIQALQRDGYRCEIQGQTSARLYRYCSTNINNTASH